MSTYDELLEQKRLLEARIREARERELGAAMAQIRALMERYGIDPTELGAPRARARNARSGRPPKYRDPKTGKTWSGRGRTPRWLGTNREDFLIHKE